MANTIIQRGSYGTTVYASAARTATPDTVEVELGSGWDSLTLVVDTTAAGSSPSTVFKVEWVDRVSGKLFSAASMVTAAITGTGTVVMTINPFLTASGTAIYKDAVHPVARVTATHGNATSHTYTASLIAA
jgi:hypothetical protein